jgi:hypothetical protein
MEYKHFYSIDVSDIEKINTDYQHIFNLFNYDSTYENDYIIKGVACITNNNIKSYMYIIKLTHISIFYNEYELEYLFLDKKK